MKEENAYIFLRKTSVMHEEFSALLEVLLV